MGSGKSMGFVTNCARAGLGGLLLESGLRIGNFTACTFLPGAPEAGLCHLRVDPMPLSRMEAGWGHPRGADPHPVPHGG